MKNVKYKGFVGHIEKDDKDIEHCKAHNLPIKKSITTNSSPNTETIKAMIDADTGKVTKTSGRKDFYKKIKS